jgi:predicted glycoside hydrolase/deacetylase ChbG (UPF0249 family)
VPISSHLSTEGEPILRPLLESLSLEPADNPSQSGVLIINADDWGRDAETTDRIFECVLRNSVSSVSGMVFMEDSERSGAMAKERDVDVGLHLNFTTPFSASLLPTRLAEHQERTAHFLLRNRLAQVVYHPGLANSFEYLVKAQVEDFHRIYGEDPRRVDGHHHMHLCSNVLLAGLLPKGTIARRNFSFQRAEKSGLNRLYRKVSDRILAARHRLADFFFDLLPIEPQTHLDRIITAAMQSAVEVETHPINPVEYRFLTGGGFSRLTQRSPIAKSYTLFPLRTQSQ